jgi:hypothetical protein
MAAALNAATMATRFDDINDLPIWRGDSMAASSTG